MRHILRHLYFPPPLPQLPITLSYRKQLAVSRNGCYLWCLRRIRFDRKQRPHDSAEETDPGPARPDRLEPRSPGRRALPAGHPEIGNGAMNSTPLPELPEQPVTLRTGQAIDRLTATAEKARQYAER